MTLDPCPEQTQISMLLITEYYEGSGFPVFHTSSIFCIGHARCAVIPIPFITLLLIFWLDY